MPLFDEMRVRAARLKDGKFDGADIMALMLGLRQFAENRPAFKDVADFIAHRDTRYKGPMAQRVRDQALHWLLFRAGFAQDHPWIADRDMIVKILRAGYRCLGAEDIARSLATDIGVLKPTSVVASRFGRVLRKVVAFKNGEFLFSSHMSDLERLIATRIKCTFSGAGPYNGDVLFEQFLAVMVDRRIVGAEEIDDFEHMRGPIALFAASQMHQTHLELEDFGESSLVIGEDDKGRLLVNGFIQEKPFPLITSVFNTGLTVAGNCAAELQGGNAKGAIWNQPLELGPGWKLRPMGTT